MISIALGRWSSSSGVFLVASRMYWRGRWTPFVRLRKRYATWLGYFKR